jgi:hypothetical protein
MSSEQSNNFDNMEQIQQTDNNFKTFVSKYKYYIIGISAAIIALIVIIIIIVVVSNSNKEKYCGCHDDILNDNSKYTDEELKQLKESRETFVSTGGSAFVNKQGDLEGAHLYTDMHSSVPFSSLRNAVMNNKPIPVNETIGAGKGDNFDQQFQSWRVTQEKDGNDPTAVKSMAEIEETSKSVSVNLGNDTSCMLTRAGASKAKIKLEPTGTAAVCSEYKTPERDRNHTIYQVNYLVEVPGFQMDTNRINDELTSNGSWAKNFSPNQTKNIAVAGATANEPSAIAPAGETIAETFSSSGY